jgi:hypothetical protein
VPGPSLITEKDTTMKILVATTETQGARTTDYSHGIEGELVWLADPCDRGRDGYACDCTRAFTGLASSRATTTAMVVDMPHLTFSDYEDAVSHGLDQAGWPGGWGLELACQLSGLASRWEVGAVIERDDDVLRSRRVVRG